MKKEYRRKEIAQKLYNKINFYKKNGFVVKEIKGNKIFMKKI